MKTRKHDQNFCQAPIFKELKTITLLLILAHHFTYNYCNIVQTIVSALFKQINHKQQYLFIVTYIVANWESFHIYISSKAIVLSNEVSQNNCIFFPLCLSVSFVMLKSRYCFDSYVQPWSQYANNISTVAIFSCKINVMNLTNKY